MSYSLFNIQRITLVFVAIMKLSTYAQSALPQLVLQDQEQEIVVSNGAQLKVELYTGQELKGKLFILSDHQLLIDGEEVKLNEIKKLAVQHSDLNVHLGESATKANKSILSALNTAGNSVRSYLLWYVQEFFKNIPEQINLKNIIGTTFDRNKGGCFYVNSANNQAI